MDEPSQRIWDQHTRNRVGEQMWDLARGNERVRRIGPRDDFNDFFDWFPSDGTWDPNPSMSAEEVDVCREVLAAMCAANDATSRYVKLDEFVETGWPDRIKPLAERAARIFAARGRFDEEHEEDQPSYGSLLMTETILTTRPTT